MAQAESPIAVEPFKDGFAVVNRKGDNPIRDDDDRPTGLGEVITRTNTEAEAKEYADRLKAGKQAIRPALVPGEEI